MFPDLDRQNIQKLVNAQLQQKNKLKFLLVPTKEGFTSIGGAAALTGNLITTLYIQTITFPGGPKLEYEETSARVKGLVKPEQVSFTFLEDENGTVWRYLQSWRKSIVYVSPPKGDGLSPVTSALFSSNVEYVFSDNQEASERIGILLLSSGKKMGYKFPRIMFYGLKFKEFEDITVGYTEQNNLTYTVTCAVREIGAPLV